jgi:hypothetical protein
MKLSCLFSGIPGAIAWALLTVGAFDLLNIYGIGDIPAFALSHVICGSLYVFVSLKGRKPEEKGWCAMFRILMYVGFLAGIQFLFYRLILIDFARFPAQRYLLMLSVVTGLLVLAGLLLRKIKPVRRKLTIWIHGAALVLSIPMLLLTTLYNVNILNYRSPIPFSSNLEIDLQMFNGWNRPGNTLEGSSRFAFITTTVEYEYQADHVVVEAFFHPSRSYVYNKNIRNRFLLKHEIYHFHIAEYQARVLRKRISEFDDRPSPKMLELEYESVMADEDRMQYQYDHQTAHGYILGKQKFWVEKIDSLMNRLQAFESPMIYFE